MSVTTEKRLSETIEHALRKIQAKKESDICRYLPSQEGRYIHHFTYKKLKEDEPEKCLSLIEEFILNTAVPRELEPKSRAPRGIKRVDSRLKLPSDMMAKVIQMAREANDHQLLTKLIGTKSLAQIKRDLIRSIRANKIDVSFWEGYKEALSQIE